MEELQGNSERSHPTEIKDDAETRNDFWSMGGNFIYRHHVEPQVQLYVPKEDTFPITCGDSPKSATCAECDDHSFSLDLKGTATTNHAKNSSDDVQR